ncbi:glycogen synthase [Sphingobacterium faecium]|uniref:glycogen synthase n=1 Tax=Sphingobacterium faecium TaxID=34087 RepID=UPI00320A2B3E
MKVIHLSVECFPVAKVGGLADVVGALPKYQRKLGIDASVVMPWYDRKFTQENKFDQIAMGSFYQGSEQLHYEIWKEASDQLGFPLYLIRIPGKLDREEVYCYPDEAEQWLSFQHAFLHWLKADQIMPDLINCHDHHVGLVPFLLKYSHDFQQFSSVKTLFTVHNGQYQGWMNWNKGILMPSFDTWRWGLLDWDGLINPMAAAVKCCDAFSTVSEGYLKELFVDANGLQDLFKAESQKGYGIVNGIDTEYWNPMLDTLIHTHYDSTSVKKGKYENKKALCEQYKLDPSLPLMSFIGRFAIEKGADLLAEIIAQLLGKVKAKMSIFILGSGDQDIQAALQQVMEKYPQQLAVYFGYNESLAHQVYAATDLLLMPSRVEPCGLNQLYALQYGTIPVVRGIGGLRDTVIDIQEPNGYGIVFPEARVTDATEGVIRALKIVAQADLLSEVRDKEMNLDFSWHKSAQKYLDLYTKLLN